MNRTTPLIAVVDDDVVLNTLVSATLTCAGYRTVSMHVGLEAEAVIWTVLPDLVILDMQMEHVDSGWQVLQQMRQDQPTMHIPVIICSGAQQFLVDHDEQLHAHGCYILEKSCVTGRLLGMVKEVIGIPTA